VIDLKQSQPGQGFQFPLEIALIMKDGSKNFKTVQVSSKSQQLTIPASVAPKNLILDPDTWLLFEGSITQK
jgi:aminopeptidase N